MPLRFPHDPRRGRFEKTSTQGRIVLFDLSPAGVALVVGFPLMLLLLVLFLGRLESWVLMPDERAAAVAQLLEQVDEAEDLERAVTLMMSEVTDRAGSKKPSASARRRALRLAGRRRTSKV